MGWHHRRNHLIAQPLVWSGVLLQNAREGSRIGRNFVVGIGRHGTMAREVFAAGSHASQTQTLTQGACQHGDYPGITVEGSIADDAANAVIEIEHGGEAEIDSAGAQLGREHIADVGCNPHGNQRIFHPAFTQRPHARQYGESIGAEALHATAFMIDGDQQARSAQFVNGAGQVKELSAALEIAGEQNDAADERVRQALALGFCEREPVDVDHEGAAGDGELFLFSGHGGLPGQSGAAIRGAGPRPRHKRRRIRIHR